MEYILLIKECRLSRNMTQSELARKARLRQAYISQLESNHPKAKSPTLRVVFKLARALDTCPHLIVRYSGCSDNCFRNCKKKIF